MADLDWDFAFDVDHLDEETSRQPKRAPKTSRSRSKSVAPAQDRDGDVEIQDDFDIGAERDDGGGRGFNLGILGEEVDDGGEESLVQELFRHWLNERHSPDILPINEVLLAGLLDRIRKQTSDVQLLRSDPNSSEDEHFRIMLVQTEVERLKFVIRSYMRTRLFKVEKYAQFITSHPEVHDKLSKAELEHAQRYTQTLEAHFTNSVLQSLPPEQQSLNEDMVFMPPMIPEPDKNRPVFAHARRNCPPVRLPDGSMIEMEKGQISLLSYSVIEQMLLRGEVELV
ncbi:DNA replication complex GINS protein SLD5 [Abortiporus biennis]